MDWGCPSVGWRVGFIRECGAGVASKRTFRKLVAHAQAGVSSSFWPPDAFPSKGGHCTEARCQEAGGPGSSERGGHLSKDTQQAFGFSSLLLGITSQVNSLLTNPFFQAPPL